MSCYIISCDVQNSQNHERLREAIKRYGTWARITDSTWAVVTDDEAEEVRDYLLKVLDEDDRLFVVRSGVAAAWKNVRCRDEWLKKHL